MERKRVYTFGNGKAEGKADMRNLLGGKGANLAEMNLIGVPVPPGFTITTEVCIEYYELGKDKVVELLKADVEKAIANIETLMNSKFGDCQSSVSFSLLRCPCVHARYDGYDIEPWLERRGSGRIVS